MLEVRKQCLACHMELAHQQIVPTYIDVRDPQTTFVADGPPIPRTTSGFDEPAAVHEGQSGMSLADGFAMLEGYESAEDRYRDTKK